MTKELLTPEEEQTWRSQGFVIPQKPLTAGVKEVIKDMEHHCPPDKDHPEDFGVDDDLYFFSKYDSINNSCLCGIFRI